MYVTRPFFVKSWDIHHRVLQIWNTSQSQDNVMCRAGDISTRIRRCRVWDSLIFWESDVTYRYKSYQYDDTHFIIELKWLEGVFLCLHLMNLSTFHMIILIVLMQKTTSKQMTDFVTESFLRAQKIPLWVLCLSSVTFSVNGRVFKAWTNGELLVHALW